MWDYSVSESNAVLVYKQGLNEYEIIPQPNLLSAMEWIFVVRTNWCDLSEGPYKVKYTHKTGVTWTVNIIEIHFGSFVFSSKIVIDSISRALVP